MWLLPLIILVTALVIGFYKLFPEAEAWMRKHWGEDNPPPDPYDDGQIYWR